MGSVSTDIVDDFAPTLSVKFSVDSEPRSGLIDTGAAASFINTSMIFDLIKSGSIKREDIIKLLSYLEAMALVRAFGKPDIFVTITAYHCWREITENLSHLKKYEHGATYWERVG